jgi:DNA-directed RNA polymerase subunit RPC12/RpoP
LVSNKNRLSVLYPKLSEEWDYKENYPLTPKDVSFGSDKSASWICSKCSHKWRTNTILERSRGNGCPLCSGKIVTDKNRFTVLYPEIAKQWNIKKNKKLNSKDFSYGSNKEVWWLCGNCEYEWKTSIGNRCSKNSGCPVCSGKMKLTLKYCRDFAKKKGYKLIAKEYINAHEKMIFVHEKCGEDLVLDWHHFQQGQECLECTLKLRESKLANKLKKYYKSNFNADLESKKVKNPLTQYFLRYDIYLPKEKIFIEIHGGQHYSFVPYWHKTIENFEYCVYKDKIKKDFAEANGIYLELDLRDRWTVEQAINKINEVIDSL